MRKQVVLEKQLQRAVKALHAICEMANNKEFNHAGRVGGMETMAALALDELGYPGPYQAIQKEWSNWMNELNGDANRRPETAGSPQGRTE